MLESTSDKPATIAEVTCPMLALYGTLERSGQEMLQTIRARATGTGSVETQLVDGADHVYSGEEERVAQVISEWIAALVTGPPHSSHG
jgi:hypothetical protein